MRNLVVTFLVLFLLLWCLLGIKVVHAAPPTAATCPGPDQLGGALTAAGVATQAITGHGQSSFTFQVVATAGSATAGLVVCCTGSCDTSTGNWALIGTTGALAAATPLTFQVSWPSACLYSIQITSPTSLTATAWVACGGPG